MGALVHRWIKRLGHDYEVGPFEYEDLFQAGTTKEITAGQLLERTADTNTRWVPIDSDHDAAAGAGLCIMGEDVTAGDLAGRRKIIVPRPGDVFEFNLQTASAIVPETALYYSATTPLGTYLHTSGSNILGYSVVGPNRPGLQGRLSQGQLGDKGETFLSTNRVWVVFRAAVSFYKTIQKA